ncbi:Omp85 family outer membrane protein [Cystobacter fuscus]
MHPNLAMKALLLAALTTAPAFAQDTSGQDAPSKQNTQTGWRIQGLPIINFNTDAGVGLGARVLLVDAGDGSQRPYRFAFTAQFYQTFVFPAQFDQLKVDQVIGESYWHFLGLDAPGILSSPWRLEAQMNMSANPYSQYFGLGGKSTYEKAFVACKDREALESSPDVCPDNPDFRGLRYYNFKQTTFPGVMLSMRRALWGPLELKLGYRFRLTEVSSPYTQARDTRLEEDANAGLITGLNGRQDEPAILRTAEVSASLLMDTRDNEPVPTSGIFHELGMRAAHEATGSDYSYWGATAHLRFYHPVKGDEQLVVALRLLADVMDGHVPFHLLSSFGGVGWQGIGGAFTARGMLGNRIQGKVKVLANGELRWRFLSVSALQQKFDFTRDLPGCRTGMGGPALQGCRPLPVLARWRAPYRMGEALHPPAGGWCQPHGRHPGILSGVQPPVLSQASHSCPGAASARAVSMLTPRTRQQASSARPGVAGQSGSPETQSSLRDASPPRSPRAGHLEFLP